MMEGESVALNTGVTEVQKYYLIQWMFGETQIAEISRLPKAAPYMALMMIQHSKTDCSWTLRLHL